MLTPPEGSEAPRVLVRHRVCQFLDRMAESSYGVCESGGILIGCRRGPHIEIVDMTSPQAGDSGAFASFVKEDPGHQRAATKAWRESGGLSSYIGEWHSHPLGDPHPSGTDRSTWRQVVRSQRQVMVFVIAAPSGWAAFLIRAHWMKTNMTRLTYLEEGTIGRVYG